MIPSSYLLNNSLQLNLQESTSNAHSKVTTEHPAKYVTNDTVEKETIRIDMCDDEVEKSKDFQDAVGTNEIRSFEFLILSVITENWLYPVL